LTTLKLHFITLTFAFAFHIIAAPVSSVTELTASNTTQTDIRKISYRKDGARYRGHFRLRDKDDGHTEQVSQQRHHIRKNLNQKWAVTCRKE